MPVSSSLNETRTQPKKVEKISVKSRIEKKELSAQAVQEELLRRGYKNSKINKSDDGSLNYLNTVQPHFKTTSFVKEFWTIAGYNKDVTKATIPLVDWFHTLPKLYWDTLHIPKNKGFFFFYCSVYKRAKINRNSFFPRSFWVK